MLNNTATVHTTVSQTNTAQAVGSGDLPVFATPAMIALMEQAACQAIAAVLEPGQSSVGTAIAVQHTAASLVGAEISASATVAATNGRQVEFMLAAHCGGQEIGCGTHTRFIIDAARFMGKLEQA